MINEKNGQGTHSTKVGADKSAESPKIYLPKLYDQARKFGILMEKGFIERP